MLGAFPRAVAARAADPRRLEILDNTADPRTVAVPSLGLTAANFRQAGTVGSLGASAPASVLVRERQAPPTAARWPSADQRVTSLSDPDNPGQGRAGTSAVPRNGSVRG
ncbi:polysaccharide lyase beta-sandwich domain-containing protein [Streptomyces sp. NPDC059909]|uniref:polysaccharide lyase beta-sandwich domain-containing protein n=1 Tax=Streptomyces sp. NPDC059909 TaxID=3346998 RepID=UPI00365A4973